MVSFTHERNIICSQIQLDEIAHEQAIICRQLFAGHVMGFWPVKRKKDFASNDNKHYCTGRLHAQCVISKSTVKPCLVRWCVCCCFFYSKQCIVKQYYILFFVIFRNNQSLGKG